MLYAALCLIIVLLSLLCLILCRRPPAAQPPDGQREAEAGESRPLPYEKKFLLTKDEWVFYKELRRIAQKYRLHVLSKVRMADLIQVKGGLSHAEWEAAFERIKSRHVDFVLANPVNLYPLLLIELDGPSHESEQTRRRDRFVDEAYRTAGLPILHVRGAARLEEHICAELGLPLTEQPEKADGLTRTSGSPPAATSLQAAPPARAGTFPQRGSSYISAGG